MSQNIVPNHTAPEAGLKTSTPLYSRYKSSLFFPVFFIAIATLFALPVTALLGFNHAWAQGLLAICLFIFFQFAYLYITSRCEKPLKTPQSKLSQNQISTNEPISKNLEFAIAEGLQEAIFILDRDHIITYANQAARRLFPDVKLRRPLSNYVQDPNVAMLVKDTLNGHISDPKSITLPGSVDRHLRVSGAPIHSAQNGTTSAQRAVIILTDVTEIEKTNTQRADFLANASHELKTPIASLLGYIETLRGHAKDDPEAQDMFLGIMQEQAERMQRLITDMLSLRKIELSEHMIPSERADLSLAVKAALEAVHPIADSRKIYIEIKSGPKEALIMGRQDELVQLVLNLVDNAVRMSAPQSRVHLEMDKVDNWQTDLPFRANSALADGAPRRQIVIPPRTHIPYWRLTIRDSGPGFNPDHLPRLGERFYRIAGDRSSKEKGTGLGLAIVKHIVRWHRGGLYIESEQGVGSEFTILMPVAPEDNPRGDSALSSPMDNDAS